MSGIVRKMPKSVDLRRTPQQGRGKESRSRILDGAKKILSQGGIEKFNMRRISAASSVGLSTIYDYFPSKTSVLQVLLEERLKLQLAIFDHTIANIPAEAKLPEFIDTYLQNMRSEGMWSAYDSGLNAAARQDDSLQDLFDWHEEETIDRYVRAFRLAGSNWADADLRTAASYLISISAQFEPGAVPSTDKDGRKLMLELVHQTFAMVLKKLLDGGVKSSG